MESSEARVLCGRDQLRSPPRSLRAGTLSAELDGYQLCHVAVGGTEIVRRIYFAVRGREWSTIPGETRDTTIRETEGRFEVAFEVVHRRDDVHFRWQGAIVGRADGSFDYEARGEPLSEFIYYRIGLCVLHPLEGSVGAQFVAETPTGVVRGTLPTDIGPKRYGDDGLDHVEIPAFSGLALRQRDGSRVCFSFEGDLFELEDQRNYTDASFKSYSTPLSLPLEHAATPAQHLVQRVTVRAECPASGKPVRRTRARSTIEMREDGEIPFPRIGFGIGQAHEEFSAAVQALLKPLRAAHLRLDLRVADTGCSDRLAAAAARAAQLGSSLELGLILSGDGGQLWNLADARVAVPVDRVLVFHDAEVSTSPQMVDLARGCLRHLAAAAFGGGTLGDFAEVNAVRPPPGVFDVVAWRSSPQVHANDEVSMVETLPVLADILRTAHSFCGTSALVVSPITLKPNGARPSEESAVDLSALPDETDARQASLFGAAWTLGGLKYLTRGRPQALTFYELMGGRGLMGGNRLSADSPFEVYPMYHVFLDIAERANALFVDCEASHPERVDGFALSTLSGTTFLVCNMTAIPQQVAICPVEGREIMLRRLSAPFAQAAMRSPWVFRKLRDRESVSGGLFEVTLGPYEVARVDVPTH